MRCGWQGFGLIAMIAPATAFTARLRPPRDKLPSSWRSVSKSDETEIPLGGVAFVPPPRPQ